jgi:hypothetical protein
MKHFAAFLCLALTAHAELSEAELDSIGSRVWKNECAGTREGLTSWNAGEDFASLGIGHFIWYPSAGGGPFEESFPKLLEFLQANGTHLPDWLRKAGPCPWQSRAEFDKAIHSERMEQLRSLLASTIRVQSRFLAQRMERSLPKMLSSVPAAQRAHVEKQFSRLSSTGAGTFALIDYVNFKGEGTSASERYKEQGWGLLQVLAEMGNERPATTEFAEAAAAVLAQRVKNSPPDRHESRWLPGWTARVRSYAK